eukprot:GDKJ01056600.1.p1 GENE.GDKJ01056600.1~~GDKJ01056600.1.p1  ORF type:complete len:661 (+),score=154.48 GDKJ01056600.1:35-1984(+)
MNFEAVSNDAVAEAKKNIEILLGGFRLPDLDPSASNSVSEVMKNLDSKLGFLNRKFAEELQKTRKAMLTEFRNAASLWEAEKERMSREVAQKYESMYQDKLEALKRTLALSESQIIKTKEEVQSLRQVVNNQEIFISMMRDQWNTGSNQSQNFEVKLEIPRINSSWGVDETHLGGEVIGLSLELQKEKEELSNQLMARADLIELLQGEISTLQRQLEDAKQSTRDQQEQFTQRLLEMNREQRENEEAIAAKVEGFVSAYEAYKGETTREIEVLTLLNSRQLVTIRRLEEDRERSRYAMQNEHEHLQMANFAKHHDSLSIKDVNSSFEESKKKSPRHTGSPINSARTKFKSGHVLRSPLIVKNPSDDVPLDYKVTREFVEYGIDAMGMNFTWKECIPPPKPMVGECVKRPIFRAIRDKTLMEVAEENGKNGLVLAVPRFETSDLFFSRSPNHHNTDSKVVDGTSSTTVVEAVKELKSIFSSGRYPLDLKTRHTNLPHSLDEMTERQPSSHVQNPENFLKGENNVFRQTNSTAKTKFVRSSRLNISLPSSSTSQHSAHTTINANNNSSRGNLASDLSPSLVLDFVNPITGKLVRSGCPAPPNFTRAEMRAAREGRLWVVPAVSNGMDDLDVRMTKDVLNFKKSARMKRKDE